MLDCSIASMLLIMIFVKFYLHGNKVNNLSNPRLKSEHPGLFNAITVALAGHETNPALEEQFKESWFLDQRFSGRNAYAFSCIIQVV